MELSKHHSLVGVIMKSNDPYEILGVSKFGDKQEIDKCYKWTMSKVHPDKNSHPLATKAAQKVNISRDILLKGVDVNVKLEEEMSELYGHIRDETVKLLKNFRVLLFFVPLLVITWSFHLLHYLLANEWSLTKTSLHSVERTTTLYRIKYYALSESSQPPPEYRILLQYLESVYQSCRSHFLGQPWYAFFLYFPEDDLCTDVKLTFIYTVIISAATLILLRRYFKKRTNNT